MQRIKLLFSSFRNIKICTCIESTRTSSSFWKKIQKIMRIWNAEAQHWIYCTYTVIYCMCICIMVDIEPLFGPKIRITTALAFTVYVHIPIRKSGSEIQTQIVGYKALAVCYERSNKILCNLLLPTSIPIHAGIWVTLDPHLIICSPRLYCKPGNNLHNIIVQCMAPGHS